MIFWWRYSLKQLKKECGDGPAPKGGNGVSNIETIHPTLERKTFCSNVEGQSQTEALCSNLEGTVTESYRDAQFDAYGCYKLAIAPSISSSHLRAQTTPLLNA